MKGKRIAKRTNEKRGRVKARQKLPKLGATWSMVPLLRCSRSANACPGSGSIVSMVPGADSHDCIVCGRILRLRGRPNRRGQVLGRLPTHRREDLRQHDEARSRVERLRCRFDRAEKAMTEAITRRAWKRAGLAALRARAVAERLPPDPRREIRLKRLEARLFNAKANAERARGSMPRDAKRLLNAIVDASAIDIGAIEPDGFIEHIAPGLPQRTLVSIAKEPSTRWIRLGLIALLRRAAPRTWDDLERRAFAGQRSVMDFVREFPGLELMRLPDRAYEQSVAAEMIDGDVPF